MADREFIAAKDLPVTEAEEVEVLVVDAETGELAKKPGANLGGGGEQTDLVISLTAPDGNHTPMTIDTTSVVIESGSLDAIVEALKAGRPPVVKCKRFFIYNGFDTSVPIADGGVYDCDVLYYNGSINIQFVLPYYAMVRIVMDIEDPDYLDVWYYPLMMTAIQVI
jgi:hypothetical protein